MVYSREDWKVAETLMDRSRVLMWEPRMDIEKVAIPLVDLKVYWTGMPFQ